MTGVEDVMDFCSEEDRKKFLKGCPMFDQVLVNNGIILLKYWLDVSEKEQHPRFLARIEDPTEALETQPHRLGIAPSLRRLFARTRCHALCHRCALRAVAPRSVGCSQATEASPASEVEGPTSNPGSSITSLPGAGSVVVMTSWISTYRKDSLRPDVIAGLTRLLSSSQGDGLRHNCRVAGGSRPLHGVPTDGRPTRCSARHAHSA